MLEPWILKPSAYLEHTFCTAQSHPGSTTVECGVILVIVQMRHQPFAESNQGYFILDDLIWTKINPDLFLGFLEYLSLDFIILLIQK